MLVYLVFFSPTEVYVFGLDADRAKGRAIQL